MLLVCFGVMVVSEDGFCRVFWHGNILGVLYTLDLFIVLEESTVDGVPTNLCSHELGYFQYKILA